MSKQYLWYEHMSVVHMFQDICSAKFITLLMTGRWGHSFMEMEKAPRRLPSVLKNIDSLMCSRLWDLGLFLSTTQAVFKLLGLLESIHRVTNSTLCSWVFEQWVNKCETRQVHMKSKSLCELVEQVSNKNGDKFQNKCQSCIKLLIDSKAMQLCLDQTKFTNGQQNASKPLQKTFICKHVFQHSVKDATSCWTRGLQWWRRGL